MDPFLKCIRLGKITQLYPERYTARVQYLDLDGQISNELKILVPSTQNVSYYTLPSPDELVLTVHLPGDLTSGYIVGSFFSKSIPVPDSFQTADKTALVFSDETEAVYDTEEHAFSASISGSFSGTISENLNLTVTETLDITGEDAVTITAEKKMTLASSEDIVISPGEDKKIKLGSDNSAEPLVLGNAYKTLYNDLVEKVKSHTHDVPQSPSGTQTSAVSTSLQSLSGISDSELSGITVTE